MSSAEIRQLSEQMAELGRRMDTLSSLILDVNQRLTSVEGTGSQPAQTRTKGYVNWNSSHDVLKSQRWVKLSTLKVYIGQMEGLWNFSTGQTNIENLPTSKDVVGVDENSRFPKNDVYVNIYSPRVSAELSALKQQRVRPGTGLLQRFDDNCKDEMQTFSSFEEKYQLNWVD